MRIYKNDVNRVVQDKLQEKAEASASGNVLISKAEQAQIEPGLIRDAAEAVRAQGGKGARVRVDDVVAVAAERVRDSIDVANQPNGPGRHFISQREVRAMEQKDAPVGAHVRRAYEILAEQARGGDVVDLAGAALRDRLADLAEGLILDDFASEAGAPMTAVHIPAGLASLDEQSFVRALGLNTDLPREAIARFLPAQDALDNLVETNRDAWWGPADRAQRVTELAERIGGLKDARAVIVGTDNYDSQLPVYLVGLDARGDLVGVRSTVVWT